MFILLHKDILDCKILLLKRRTTTPKHSYFVKLFVSACYICPEFLLKNTFSQSHCRCYRCAVISLVIHVQQALIFFSCIMPRSRSDAHGLYDTYCNSLKPIQWHLFEIKKTLLVVFQLKTVLASTKPVLAYVKDNWPWVIFAYILGSQDTL